MRKLPDYIDIEALERLAATSSLAVALTDESGEEVGVANNSSVCASLNSAGKFSPECAEDCGRAFERTKEEGSLGYECHAGLECRTVRLETDEKPLVAIVGRAFVKSEAYRNAADRAINGDWKRFPPTRFFSNILMSSSAEKLDQTAERTAKFSRPKEQPAKRSAESISEQLNTMVERFNREITREEPPPLTKPERDRRSAAWAEWRSFFGLLISYNYEEAAGKILEFIATQFGTRDLAWLDVRDDRFETMTGVGALAGRKINLPLNARNEQLVEAYRTRKSFKLRERGSAPDGRTLELFPIGVGEHLSATIASVTAIDESKSADISRLARSLGIQLEILRLRSQVARGESLKTAVRNFTDSLGLIETSDVWLRLTQNAAEALRAERASLMIYDPKAEAMKVKAIIGTTWRPQAGEPMGERVANAIFEQNLPALVADVSKTSLPPLGEERHYKTASFLSCPISLAGRAVGVVNFTDRACGKSFDSSALELFEAIAPQLAVVVDRANLQERAGEFEQLSVTDELTGLLNRRYIEARLLEEVKRSNRHGFPMSFMMLDVDNFKSFNDTFGHPAGDEALRHFARIIRETLRGADVAARFGGEEFAILLPQTTIAEAAILAERVRANVEQSDFPHRRVTTSIGVASCTAELCISADLVAAADKALYEAKRDGRNRVRLAGPNPD